MHHHLSAERIQKLQKVIDDMKGGCTLITTQADPDSIAMIMAMIEIINHRRNGGNNFRIKAFYAGAIGHPQNQALFNRFDLKTWIRPFSQFTQEDNRNVILVDSSSKTDGRLGSVKIDPVIVLDHHADGNIIETDTTFVWVDTSVGAASTLVYELMQVFSVPFAKESSMVPTLLAIGIHSDTGGVIDCSERDRHAYDKVIRAVDTGDVDRLFNYGLPPSYYDQELLSLQNQYTQDGILVTHIGMIKSEFGDNLSTFADHLIRRIGVTLVLVWGILEDEKVIRISARSTDISMSLHQFLKQRFPPNSSGAKVSPEGKGIGGARVQVDFGPCLMPETREEAVALASKYVRTVVFRR